MIDFAVYGRRRFLFDLGPPSKARCVQGDMRINEIKTDQTKPNRTPSIAADPA